MDHQNINTLAKQQKWEYKTCIYRFEHHHQNEYANFDFLINQMGEVENWELVAVNQTLHGLQVFFKRPKIKD